MAPAGGAEAQPAPLHGALLLKVNLPPHPGAVWVSTSCLPCLLQALVATNDSVDAFSLLQNMAPMSYDSSRLIDVACIAFAGVSDKQLAVLRQAHRQTVIAQFAVRETHCWAVLLSLLWQLSLAGIPCLCNCYGAKSVGNTCWQRGQSPAQALVKGVIRHGS